jgi:hypothetical protein
VTCLLYLISFQTFIRKRCWIYFILASICCYFVLCTDKQFLLNSQIVQCKLAKSLLRRLPRNQFLPAQYVGTSWRSPPQQFVAISFVLIASRKPSSFRRNALLVGGPWEQATTIAFTFRILTTKVNILYLSNGFIFCAISWLSVLIKYRSVGCVEGASGTINPCNE